MSMRPERDVGWRKFYNERLVRMLKGGFFIFFCSIFIVLILNFNAPFSSAEGDCDCNVCHSSSAHGVDWQGCSTCHDSPPQTTAHLTHYNSAPVKELVYGDTAIASVDDAYKFGCGNCHPLDNSAHQDGKVDVELYNAAAPADSLKAKNPETAAYDTTSKTCSNVYCHSGYTVTSTGTVGEPLSSPPYPAPPLGSGYEICDYDLIMDDTCSMPTYGTVTTSPTYTITPGYTVNYYRVYKTTPKWGAAWVATDNTYKLTYKSQAANFTVGNNVIGGTSGSTGRILSDYNGGTVGVLRLSGITGTFLADELVTETAGATGSAIVDSGTLEQSCTQCHDFPLTTYYPLVQKAVGDSHQWIDQYGWSSLHGNNMYTWSWADFSPVQCRTCHYDTVKEAGTNPWPGFYGTDPNREYVDWVEWGPVPLASRAKHVNGIPDVVFDKVNSVIYNYDWSMWGMGVRTHSYSLSNASYDSTTKTCSNVACHYYQGTLTSPRYQQKVKWGAPYGGAWSENAECNLCHRM